jgi:hypothetical protein
LLATVEAYQKNNLNSVLRSTGSFSFMQVVNGPIVQQLKMNSGTGALSPGNRANAAMGRALRLFTVNLGGGVPGVNLMAIIGNVSSYSFMFAENEKETPWESLSATLGHQKNANTLAFFVGGWAHSGNYGPYGPDFAGEVTLDSVVRDIAGYQITNGAVVIVSPKLAQDLQRRGMSKADVESYLQKHATREPRKDRPGENGPVPVFPEGSVKVVVAGGDASQMMQAWCMGRPMIVSIDKWR